MKKLFTSLAICLIGLTYAQSPQKMSYQAVVRNASGLDVVALKAIQEQQEIIKNLEARIKQLESKK